MERIRTIVRRVNDCDYLFFNLEDVLRTLKSSYNYITFDYWLKKYKRYEQLAKSQFRLGFDHYFEVLQEKYIEKIQGANGEREDLYLTYRLLGFVLWEFKTLFLVGDN